ncbi:hypothetical protein H0H87_010144, partial [Tephrocybe sp. NHM501043]
VTPPIDGQDECGSDSTRSESEPTPSPYGGSASGTSPAPHSSVHSPHSPFSSTSTATLTSTTLTSSTTRSKSQGRGPSPCRLTNLQDQLATSPETRFHAVYLFLRFFCAHLPCSIGLDQEGLRLVTWDIAVACLAVSVKYHRDFLDPLYPVYAHEFQHLAPHGPLGYGDLEIAHRDLLSALAFRIGGTPQGVLGEVHALRSVRGLGLDHGWGREGESGEWNCVLRETWRALFTASPTSSASPSPSSLPPPSCMPSPPCWPSDTKPRRRGTSTGSAAPPAPLRTRARTLQRGGKSRIRRRGLLGAWRRI